MVILPTKDNLKRRGVLEEELCFFCCQERETAHHILWACPSAQDVWGLSIRKLQKCSLHCSTILTSKEIWQRRNCILHGGKFTHPIVVANLARDRLLQFSQANTLVINCGDLGAAETKTKWQAPPGFYKVNWDIALSTVNNCMGIGVIVRDERGHVLAAKNQTIHATHESVTGEALAALHAAEFCRELGFFEILLKGDSMSVVKAIGENTQNWLKYGQIMEDTKMVLRSL
ncbi:uncharacterized protein LOC132174030 [Corylus avellana]|uniref:uncharacterized protein LOC132174030 n=1 Tax=Corylus avellana TaxID=13451 RepID=UPI00286A8365|nr:uncharacterized protein LOC132174030 [Corylus avellana]